MYQEQEDDEYEDQVADDLAEFREATTSTGRRAAASTGQRRSTRTSNASSIGRGITAEDQMSEWRGERRSSRLGAPVDLPVDVVPPKRAKTEESTISTNSGEGRLGPPSQSGSGLKIKINGAAALKPTETVVETVAGKKKSKFWYYAVEPILGTQLPTAVRAAPPLIVDDASVSSNGAGPSSANGHGHGRGKGRIEINGSEYSSDIPAIEDLDVYEKSIEGSLSPTSSMDET